MDMSLLHSQQHSPCQTAAQLRDTEKQGFALTGPNLVHPCLVAVQPLPKPLSQKRQEHRARAA
ncbi:MAG TPA: hypothetical protein VF811_05840 [Parasulfuritortus sp.]